MAARNLVAALAVPEGRTMTLAYADPVRYAWTALGQPAADRPVELLPGQCCRCGATGTGHPSRGPDATVSDGFSDWDRLPWRRGRANFCAACAWAFTTADLRWYPHIVSGAHTGRATPAALRAVLATALDASTTVTVPVSMQKHLLPFARWGHVSTDNIILSWTSVEATRLCHYLRLVALGFNSAAIAEPAPRWQPLSKLDPTQRRDVMLLWPELDPWRQLPPYLDVAARAARTGKDTPDDDAQRP